MLPGDWIMCDRNLDMDLPGGGTPDVAARYQSLEKVKKLEFAGILPCHDPKTLHGNVLWLIRKEM